MDKEWVCMYNWILCNLKSEVKSRHETSMTGGLYANWNKTTQKNKHYKHLYDDSKTVKCAFKQRVEWLLPGNEGGESKEILAKGYKISLTQDEYVLDICWHRVVPIVNNTVCLKDGKRLIHVMCSHYK